MKRLARLRTPFKKKGGSTTAGNCSQITDGCAVCFLARRSWAEKNNLPIIAKFISYAVKGCPPEIMGNFKYLL
jgi:acetyl-CoA acyltransferase 1